MPEQKYIPKANERFYDSINSIRGRKVRFEDIPINPNELTTLGRMLLVDEPTQLGKMLLDGYE